MLPRMPPILAPFQLKKKNENVKKGDPHQEQKNVNKGKKSRGKLKERRLVKYNLTKLD